MNHLHKFESYNDFNIKSYFNDKIDWKLVRFIEDLVTKYADEGHNTTMGIFFKDGGKYYNIYQYEFDRNTHRWCDIYEASIRDRLYLDQLYDNYTITYHTFLFDKDTGKEITDRLDEKDEIRQKVLKRFKVEAIKEYPNELRFSHTLFAISGD